jgi:phosphoglycolate phosphatase
MLIFDLDGTLLESHEGILYSLRFAIGKHAPAFLPKLHQKLIGPPISVILREISVDEELIRVISEEFRWHYDSVGVLKTKLLPGVYVGLQELSGLNDLFVSTNKPLFPTKKVLKLLKIDHFFDDIYTIDSGKFKNKSDIVSEILLKNEVLTNSNSNTGTGIVIGDSSDDFRSAIDNKLDFIYCSYGYGTIQKITNLRIAPSPSKMFNLLLELSR